MSWNPGDIAIVVNCGSYPEYNGEQVVIASIPFIDFDTCETVMIEPIPTRHGPCRKATTKNLRKPYDGNELCEWKHCAFQPKELVVVS